MFPKVKAEKVGLAFEPNQLELACMSGICILH
uniref:Uncharacterized protein n=1 Tax=Rhizophora mucronata TaxID=61149 RepID=A0A2P2JX01_RHIMU